MRQFDIDIIVPTVRQEAASEGGGQHWTVRDSDAFGISTVMSGDLVVGKNNCLVGVALTDYNAEGGFVALDITGCWALPITTTGALVGDWIYFHVGGGTPYLDNADASDGKPIGQAMDTVPAGAVVDVPVKLTPCSRDHRGWGP